MEKFYQITNKRTGARYGSKVRYADDFIGRLRGLMMVAHMDEFDGLILDPCNSIHTFFMLMPIDVIFLNKHNQVVRFYESLPPWRMTRISFSTKRVIELPAGVVHVIHPGDEIEVLCLN